ncbi:MAG: DUF4186 domain-containing protein [Leptolyngbyaceae cyanobacterium HOT.MB2.61]|nr:DUF4186 domain-containing protein [Leptolyngbyaceae cyanobacterium HOT.MB2.61]
MNLEQGPADRLLPEKKRFKNRQTIWETESMRDLEELFAKLAESSFRSSFHLREPERSYLHRKGMAVIIQHAADFVEKRLAPALPANDGKQTPYRNHPVFVAQHATGTCCRSCLEKWHGIPRGNALNEEEKRYVVSVIERWLEKETLDTLQRSRNNGCKEP